MCHVSYQIDRFLAAEDCAVARGEWLGMKAEDDNYGRYLSDAAEQIEGLSASDNAILEDSGLDAFDALSKTGKDAIQSKAVDLAIEDSFSRYDWLDSVSAPNWWIQQDKELGNDADIRY